MLDSDSPKNSGFLLLKNTLASKSRCSKHYILKLDEFQATTISLKLAISENGLFPEILLKGNKVIFVVFRFLDFFGGEGLQSHVSQAAL